MLPLSLESSLPATGVKENTVFFEQELELLVLIDIFFN